jgi:hypothetical protein
MGCRVGLDPGAAPSQLHAGEYQLASHAIAMGGSSPAVTGAYRNCVREPCHVLAEKAELIPLVTRGGGSEFSVPFGFAPVPPGSSVWFLRRSSAPPHPDEGARIYCAGGCAGDATRNVEPRNPGTYRF